jgi:hypothetical protein
MDWTTALMLFGIHMALCSVVVAMVWHGPLARQERAKEKVREYTNKK